VFDFVIARVFFLEIYKNNIFFYFKIFIFDINISKQLKKTLKNNFKQKKIKIFKNNVCIVKTKNFLACMMSQPQDVTVFWRPGC